MRILKEEPRKGSIRVRTETLDDLWELSHIIRPGDHVTGKTERKVQLGEDRSKQVRKVMTLTIAVTEVDLEHGVLRVQGTITDGPDDLISHGDHHGMSIEEGMDFELQKEWDAVLRGRLERAVSTKPLNILIVVFDREDAYLAELSRRGHTVVQHLTGDVKKKAPGGGNEDFWKTIAASVCELDERKKYSRILIASPAFWNEYLVAALPDSMKKKVSSASVSAVGEGAIAEALKRPELQEVLKTDRTSTEEQLVEALLEAIGKDKACYGKDECAEKIVLGQVAILLVSQALIERSREEDWYGELDSLLEQAKSAKAEVHLVEHITEQLDSLGGIAGVLRW